MSHLLSLCPEVLNGIFQEVNPEDLASLSKTCRLLNIFIKNDRLLWKDLYLRNYDHMIMKLRHPEPDWQMELQKLVTLNKLLQSKNSDVKREHLPDVATTAIDLLRTASINFDKSVNIAFLAAAFNNQMNIDTFLCSSSLFQKAGADSHKPAETFPARQLSAKLHVMYGMSTEPNLKPSDSNNAALAIHPYARARVYDLRRYNVFNHWGPFLDDGSDSVDWEKVQCIMIVLNHNLRAFTERTHGRSALPYPTSRDRPFVGTAPNSFKPAISCPSHAAMMVKEPIPDLAAQDPYGVTGTWRRVVCFLDYTDLYAFNFENTALLLPTDADREPIDTQEAIRLITLKIRVSAIEPPNSDPDSESNDHPDYPVVHFRGTSRSMHTSWDPNANSKIRGTVRMTREGEVRWTSFSIYHGEERWRSEGVQIGGLRSARGVLGTWFDKDYDIHGPAGPTAFWKLTDDIEVEKQQVAIISWT